VRRFLGLIIASMSQPRPETPLIDGSALPVCVVCKHRACPFCFWAGVDWCDVISSDEEWCCGPNEDYCQYGREYSMEERRQIIESLHLPDGPFRIED
jgi:hypothetical protein